MHIILIGGGTMGLVAFAEAMACQPPDSPIVIHDEAIDVDWERKEDKIFEIALLPSLSTIHYPLSTIHYPLT